MLAKLQVARCLMTVIVLCRATTFSVRGKGNAGETVPHLAFFLRKPMVTSSRGFSELEFFGCFPFWLLLLF